MNASFFSATPLVVALPVWLELDMVALTVLGAVFFTEESVFDDFASVIARCHNFPLSMLIEM